MAVRSCSLLAAVLAVVLAGCGAQDDSRPLAQDQANQLLVGVEGIRSALDDGDCSIATPSVGEMRGQIADLPAGVGGGFKRNMRQWLDQVETRIPRDCKAAQTPAPTTPAPTPAPTPVPTPVPTPP